MAVTIYVGDCRKILPLLTASHCQICVTSPPYLGLRDYGVAGQIGLEDRPEDYIDHLVEIFDLVRTVLRPDATLWLNLGDSYVSQGGFRDYGSSDGSTGRGYNSSRRGRGFGLKPKDLMFMPIRVAMALQQRGWWVRADNIWNKSNPVPESTKDRPTSAHEHVFLLSRAAKYFYDYHAAQEPTVDGGGTRNMRNVWTVPVRPFHGAHFATFPRELIEPCILAGGAIHGACTACGRPLVEGRGGTPERPCGHGDAAVARSCVIDPFFGAGTTGLAADKYGLDCIGIELNPEFAAIAATRLRGSGVDVRVVTLQDLLESPESDRLAAD